MRHRVAHGCWHFVDEITLDGKKVKVQNVDLQQLQNRRLSHALGKFKNDQRWQRIPSRLLPNDIGDREIAILLGEMHVAGKNTWTPFEKAGHVYRMHKDFALTQDEIAQRLRMSKSKVNQLVRAFDVMKNQFLSRYPGPANMLADTNLVPSEIGWRSRKQIRSLRRARHAAF